MNRSIKTTIITSLILITITLFSVSTLRADDWETISKYLVDKYSDTSPDFNIYGKWQILIPKTAEILNRDTQYINFNKDYYSFDYIFETNDVGRLKYPQSIQYDFFHWTTNWITNVLFIYFPKTQFFIKLKWFYDGKFLPKQQYDTTKNEINDAISQGLLFEKRGMLGWEWMQLDQSNPTRSEQIQREIEIIEAQCKPFNENSFLVYYSVVQINLMTGAQQEISTTYALVTRNRLSTYSDIPQM